MLFDGKEINGVRFSKANQVRFAPKGSYKLGVHVESFVKDGFIIASYGVEGAEKLGEASSKFNYPIIHGIEVEKGQEIEQTTVSAVNAADYRFNFNGAITGLATACHAFGVL